MSPAQSRGSTVQYYSERDTAPDLVAVLCDSQNNPIDLTGATVVINIAFHRPTKYYNPTKRIVDGGPCTVDPDQVNNTGVVRWTPQPGDLTPPGEFEYTFEITYASGGVQTVPPNTYLPLIIRTPVGGQLELQGNP